MSQHYLWLLRPYFRQVAGQLFLGSIAGIMMNTAAVLPTVLLGYAIDAVLAFGRGGATASAVAVAGALVVAGTIASEAPRILKRWSLNTARARIRANIRADALRGVLAWPLERLHQTSVGDLMARINGDVEVLGTGIGEFITEMWDTVLFSLSVVVAMLLYDATLTVWALLPVPFAMVVGQASGRWVSRRTTAAREASSNLTTALQEQLTAVRLLRSFGRTTAATERVAVLSQKQALANLAATRLKNGLQPVYGSLMTAGVVFVVWLGSSRVLSGELTIGGLVAFLQLFTQFVKRGPRIPQMLNAIQSGGAAYARLRPLLAPALPAQGGPKMSSFRPNYVAGICQKVAAIRTQASPLGPIRVDLNGVVFRYPGNPAQALHGVSLDVPPAYFVAVTGPIGSGKSALARALAGIYPLDAGQVLFDGKPMGALGPGGARIGYLAQDPHVFSGTLRENILLRFDERAPASNGHARPSASSRQADERLLQIIRLAALEADLASFPAGLETQIGELGIRVSGGQRQRIALARALAVAWPRSPGLLVLDDPFSAVDVDTENEIISGLRAGFGPGVPLEERTTIVLFSHRLAAFPQADLVIVLREGRLAERGTHEDLVRKGGQYAAIWHAQRQGTPRTQNGAKASGNPLQKPAPSASESTA